MALLTLAISIVALVVAFYALVIARAAVASQPALEPSKAVELPQPEPILSALSGLRIAIEVEEDSEAGTFVRLLEKELIALDVVLDPQSSIRIKGKVVGHGYSEVYWRADLVVSSPDSVLLTVTERPASGDRQANLAREVARSLEREVSERGTRSARQRALGELGPN